jgi:hypothetical protein
MSGPPKFIIYSVIFIQNLKGFFSDFNRFLGLTVKRVPWFFLGGHPPGFQKSLEEIYKGAA